MKNAFAAPRISEYGWSRDPAKRVEVVVRFLERRLNQSLRLPPGTLAERQANVKKALISRLRSTEYARIMKVAELEGSRYIRRKDMAAQVGMPLGTLKQTLRRMNRVAAELYSAAYQEELARKKRSRQRDKRRRGVIHSPRRSNV